MIDSKPRKVEWHAGEAPLRTHKGIYSWLWRLSYVLYRKLSNMTRWRRVRRGCVSCIVPEPLWCEPMDVFTVSEAGRCPLKQNLDQTSQGDIGHRASLNIVRFPPKLPTFKVKISLVIFLGTYPIATRALGINPFQCTRIQDRLMHFRE